MRILVSGGGTGGHVYPILSVVAALKEIEAASSPEIPAAAASQSSIDIRFAGTADGVEAGLARRAGLQYVPIQAGQMRISNPLRLARNSTRLLRGGMQARRLMRNWKPEAVFVTGGYVCAPVVWAASRDNIPILIYLPDVTPGLAVQRLAKYATKIAVTFPEVVQFFPDKAIVTGYPVRSELRKRDLTRQQARSQFDLDPQIPTLLIFGGSRGARSINIATAASLNDLLNEVQIIHITGELDWAQAQARAAELTAEQRQRYRPFPYLHDEFISAMCAADLVVARAGAATLGEFPALGLPAILIPLPISGGHQTPNATYLAERGAAEIIEDADLTHALFPTIRRLINDPNCLHSMSNASAALAQPDAASHIAQAILNLSVSR